MALASEQARCSNTCEPCYYMYLCCSSRNVRTGTGVGTGLYTGTGTCTAQDKEAVREHAGQTAGQQDKGQLQPVSHVAGSSQLMADTPAAARRSLMSCLVGMARPQAVVAAETLRLTGVGTGLGTGVGTGLGTGLGTCLARQTMKWGGGGGH